MRARGAAIFAVVTPGTQELLRKGFALLQGGRAEAAEHCAREALLAAPELLPALNLLAIALHAQSRNAEASTIFGELARREPAQRAHWTNLGTTLRAVNRYDEALDAYHRAEALGERSADFRYNLGLLHIDRGDYEAARVALRAAHAARPEDAEIAYQYAAACSEALDNHEGHVALEHWPRLQGLTTELTAKIAQVLMILGDAASAERALERALADPSPDALALLQLVLALERINRVPEAHELLDRLRTHPGRAALGSDMMLAEARLAERESRYEDAARHYGMLATGCVEPGRRHFHLYPMAKSLDALGRYNEAFAAMQEAHASQVLWIRQTAPEVPELRSDTMRVTRFGCDPDDVARWSHEGAPDAADSPIFIVAFPRSGTTLLEQVLDAHPRLESMDEQPYLQNAIDRLSGPDVRYPDRMAELTREQLDAARQHYWSLVRRRVSLAPGRQLIDKNPLNVLRLPAIARLFPNSRILLAVRHPCDVLVSCYMQHFRAEFAWHCRDLATLALAHRRTFDFWYEQGALLRPAVREVRYESFVAEFETEVRNLAAFLELPWTDAMLAPGEQARRRGFISTPSYAQVVQPVHSRSVGRWRAYERELADVLATLRPSLERWGYET